MSKKDQKGKIIILSGPSGAGKTTIHGRILRAKRLSGKIVRSVSMTTRLPRTGEKEGRDYYFATQKMFEYKIQAGHFLEWARVFDNYYGTPFKPVRDLLGLGKSVLLCIDVQGARQVMEKCPDAVSIFIKPPSVEELKRRLICRGTENNRDLSVRLKRAEAEMREARHYGHVVVNEDLEKACDSVEAAVYQEIQGLA